MLGPIRGTRPACPFPVAHPPLPSLPPWGHVLTSPQGSDLSLEDFQGQTPLHVAARRGHAAVVSLLLRSGAAVNARDQEGLSPLLLAVRGRYPPCVHRGAGAPWGGLDPATSGGGQV